MLSDFFGVLSRDFSKDAGSWGHFFVEFLWDYFCVFSWFFWGSSGCGSRVFYFVVPVFLVLLKVIFLFLALLRYLLGIIFYFFEAS